MCDIWKCSQRTVQLWAVNWRSGRWGYGKKYWIIITAERYRTHSISIKSNWLVSLRLQYFLLRRRKKNSMKSHAFQMKYFLAGIYIICVIYFYFFICLFYKSWQYFSWSYFYYCIYTLWYHIFDWFFKFYRIYYMIC